MSEHNVEEPLFAPPIHIATDIHAESDRLTERLLLFEAFMGGLPWKLDVTISLGYQGSQYGPHLRFMRRNDKTWALVWIEDSKQLLVKDCSLPVRARIAAAIPALLKQMRFEFDARAISVQNGHSALDALEQELVAFEAAKKEGK